MPPFSLLLRHLGTQPIQFWLAPASVRQGAHDAADAGLFGSRHEAVQRPIQDIHLISHNLQSILKLVGSADAESEVGLGLMMIMLALGRIVGGREIAVTAEEDVRAPEANGEGQASSLKASPFQMIGSVPTPLT